MKNYLLPQEKTVRQGYKRRRRWQRVVSVMAAVTALSTACALTVPAITWENSPVCGLEEHTHEEACFQTLTQETEPCALTEHEHGPDCYEVTETLLCQEEGEEHEHGEGCYQREETLICEEEEHLHNEACQPAEPERVLTCNLEEHQHDEGCFEEEPMEGDPPPEEEEPPLEDEELLDEDWLETGEVSPFSIVEPPASAPYTTGGTVSRDIAFTKTASDTDTENLFDIKLDVTLPNEKYPAVVLLVDVSNSMRNQCSVCGVPKSSHSTGYRTTTYDGRRTTYRPCSKFVERMGIAETAAVNFLNQLGSQEEFEACYVSIIAFDTTVPVYTDWYNVAEEGELNSAIAVVKNLRNVGAMRTGLSYGAKRAYDRMTSLPDGVTADSSFLVLLSDGATYDPTDALAPEATRTDTVARWLEKWKNYDHYDYIADMDPSKYMGAPYYSDKLRERGAHVYSVVLGESIDTGARGTVNNWKYIMGIGIDNIDYVASFSDYTQTATTQTSLNDFYTSVYNSVSCTVSNLTVTDPMSDYVDFLTFVDGEGNPISPPGGAMYDPQTKTITWQPNSEDKNQKLYYRVHLKNETADFVEGTEYPTNGKTTAQYDITLGSSTRHSSKDATVPRVKGCLGQLSFSKVDEQGAGLGGAVFELTHDTQNCICLGYGTVHIGTYSATSKNSGEVDFVHVPSGHRYILKETKPPEGYRLSDETHAVTVSYGKMAVDGKGDWCGKIVNKHNTVSLTVSKTVNGPDPDGAFRFSVRLDSGTLPESPLYELNEDGSACFSLTHGQSVTLTGIPYGAALTLTELGTEGYHVVMKSEDVVVGSEGCCQISMDGDRSIAVINNTGYELPATGGSGLVFLYTFGALLTTGAFMCGYMLRRKLERG